MPILLPVAIVGVVTFGALIWWSKKKSSKVKK